MIRKITLLRKGCPSRSTSSSTFAIVIYRVTRMQIASAAMGIITEFVRKSKKSRNGMPIRVMKDSGPYPSPDRVPRPIMITAVTVVETKRLQPNSSVRVETTLSVSAIALVTAANRTRTKNRIPTILPKPMLAKIFGIVRKKPERIGEIRKFMNYYLPTTLKLLDSYAMLEEQGIEGDNITASKKQISQIMDTLIKSFEKQLDQLFSSQALDISSDIEVMENMLAADGLKDSDFKLKRMGGH